jgi:hypothetical protein
VHPYRTSPVAPIAEEPDEPAEESFVLGALIVLGGVRVVVALAQRVPLDAEGTIALGMFAFGLAGAARRLARAWRLRFRSRP